MDGTLKKAKKQFLFCIFMWVGVIFISYIL